MNIQVTQIESDMDHHERVFSFLSAFKIADIVSFAFKDADIVILSVTRRSKCGVGPLLPYSLSDGRGEGERIYFRYLYLFAMSVIVSHM